MKKRISTKNVINTTVEDYYNTIRTNIILKNKNFKTIVATSIKQSNTKSKNALNIAFSFVKLGIRVLYVDCDFRKLNKDRLFKFKENLVGLRNFLEYKTDFYDIVFQTELDNFDVILAGDSTKKPLDLLQNDRINLFFEYINSEYDLVIIDVPDLNSSIDASLIARKCDSSILFVESGKSNKEEILHSKSKLENIGVDVLGIILNQVQIKTKH